MLSDNSISSPNLYYIFKSTLWITYLISIIHSAWLKLRKQIQLWIISTINYIVLGNVKFFTQRRYNTITWRSRYCSICLRVPSFLTVLEVSGLFYKTTLESFRDTNGIQTMYHVCHDQKNFNSCITKEWCKKYVSSFWWIGNLWRSFFLCSYVIVEACQNRYTSNELWDNTSMQYKVILPFE